MMLAKVETDKVRNGRKPTGQAANQGRGRAIQTKVVGMDDAQTNRSSGEVSRAVNGTNHIPVTFWGPDGGRYEGMSPHVTGEVVFVESKQMVPVETEVTICVTPPNEVLVNRAVARGVVVWQCLSSDHFKNLKGFGVYLKSRWPQPPGNDGPKEAA